MPESVEIAKVLDYSQLDGGREGCLFAVYELSSSILEKNLKPDDAPFTDEQAKGFSSNPWSAWKETPLPKDEDLFALRAAGGCYEPHAPEGTPDYLGTLPQRAGGFYTETQNREGLILVFPKERLAAYMYWG